MVKHGGREGKNHLFLSRRLGLAIRMTSWEPVTNPTPPVSPQSITATGNATALIVGPSEKDCSANGPLSRARQFGFSVDEIEEYLLVHLAGEVNHTDLDRLATTLLVDRVGQWWEPADKGSAREGSTVTIEVGFRPGVTDRQGAELVRAAGELGIGLQAASVGKRFVVHGVTDQLDIDGLANQILHNSVVERWSLDGLRPAFVDLVAEPPPTKYYDLASMGDDELVELSQSRRLGMSLDEMRVLSSRFRCLGRQASDAEIETVAQTWSEHCSHKSFRAEVVLDDGTVIDGLMKTYLKAATDTINAPWVRSAFVDNAGIVEFDGSNDIAIKAETHNHPSALEPFGGANTGVGGVVRDILGVSARPVAITDILCFGPEDINQADIPDGVLHPRRIRAGVVAGVGDYGNKIGVPTVAGAIVHDTSYTTTPLVFAGCVGVLPSGSHPTTPQAGDAIVVLGGSVGRDGIGGATFSSQTMGVQTAEIAGSSVQIGDPVVEKGLIDVVVEARDRGLYHAITDCGAGGLSSAVGEMAEPVGAKVDLSLVPRKYPGLAPWEVWLSEAQERMVLAVSDVEPILELASRWQVQAAVIGHFTGTGILEVFDGTDPVVNLDLSFLHDGRPPLRLPAIIPDTSRPDRSVTNCDATEMLLRLLAHPSIRSNEDVVRTYDHEILGGSLTRPYGGVMGDAPGDGAALLVPDSTKSLALVIGIGASVVLGRYDTEAMAWAAVDEAVANAVVAGADPDRLSLLDNFAWGDPTDPVTMGQLTAACRGCHDAALAYGAPYVSGKDSLYNVFVAPNGEKDPVTPTLIITSVGTTPPERVLPTGVVGVGNQVWLVGPPQGALGGSHYDDVLGYDNGGRVHETDTGAPDRHRAVAQAIAQGVVASLHDVSHGGIVTAGAEWALGGRLGLSLDLDDDHQILFGEGPGRYLVEVEPGNGDQFAEIVESAMRVGEVVADQAMTVGQTIRVSLDEVKQAFTGHTANADWLEG